MLSSNLMKSIARRVRERIVQHSGQRVASLKAIRQNQPLDAEPDLQRKRDRIACAVHVSTRDADAIARHRDPATLNLRGDRLLAAERIQGTTRDFVGVSFLERAVESAGSVARIAFSNGSAVGSGFLISDRLLITNHHVIQTELMSRTMIAEFDFELNANGQPKTVTRFQFAPDMCFVTDPTDDLDFTVIGLGPRISGQRSLSEFGATPLRDSADKHSLGEFVNIVQHPAGDFKQVVLRENQLVSRGKHVLHYVADTQKGSSGSPVFNDQWEVVALHHFGEPHRETVDSEGNPVQMQVNEGIRISSIVSELRAKIAALPDETQRLVRAALEPTAGSVGENTALSAVKRNAPPVVRNHPQMAADGRVTWTVPVEITLGLGGCSGTPYGAQSELIPPARVEQQSLLPSRAPYRADTDSKSQENVEIDRHYANRDGYSDTHLPGQVVPLPRMLKSLQKNTALLIRDGEETDETELKYQHFSIFVHRIRRMAIYTAVNIDGATWVHVNRETRALSESAEAREQWFDEPRLRFEHQTDQSLYDNQSLELPRRIFDRGHLVRRQDPSWGEGDDAIRANADTFHFTNCVPQHFTFNQRLTHWQGIEKYVLERAKDENIPISVFTGPVFDRHDPEFRDVQIPLAFWKILARVENDELLATAFLAVQAGLVRRVFDPSESAFDDHLRDVAHFQVSIRDVEQLTDLRFDALRDHDTINTDAAESTGGRVPILHPSDIYWINENSSD